MRQLDERSLKVWAWLVRKPAGPGWYCLRYRSITGMLEIIDYMVKYSPECWMLNYSTPIVAEACRGTASGCKSHQICDMPVGARRRMAYIVEKSMMIWMCAIFGLNHFGWWTSVKDKTTGEYYMPKLLSMCLKTVQPDLEGH